MLTIEVETNVSERTPHYPLQRPPFQLAFRDERFDVPLVSYHVNEMLATKMRALIQRRKGRDLFDLHWALTHASALPVAIPEILQAFQHYMDQEGATVPRTEFIEHLRSCIADRRGFCTDMTPLLRQGLTYDADLAARAVEQDLLSRLPD